MLRWLHNLLRRYVLYRTEDVRTSFNRVLPLGELVVDRWEKARLLGFGEGASIYDSAIVFGDVQVGAHSWIGPQVILDGAAAPVRIGDWCSISAGTHIYTHDSVGWAVTGGKAGYPSAPVTVGSRVYIGPLCVIASGVSIGEGSIIGAQSFVNTDIPPGVFACGQPARVRGAVVLTDDARGFQITHSTAQQANERD